MTTIETRLSEGSSAKEVLDNPQFQAAFTAIETEITQQWTNSPARDTEGREKCWQYLMLLKKVQTHLQSTLETGKLAQIELQHRQTIAERLRDTLRR